MRDVDETLTLLSRYPDWRLNGMYREAIDHWLDLRLMLTEE